MRTTAFPVLLLVAVAMHGVARGAGDAPRAIDAIENDLVADDPAVRAKAAAELTDRFPDGAVAVPMLVDLLDDEDASVVAAAAKAIDSMGKAGVAKLAPLIRRLEGKEGAESVITLEIALRGPRAPGALAMCGRWDSERWPPTDLNIVAAALNAPETFRDLSRPLLREWRRPASKTRDTVAAVLAAVGTGIASEHPRLHPEPERNAEPTALAEDLVGWLNSNDSARATVAARAIAVLHVYDASVIAALTSRLQLELHKGARDMDYLATPWMTEALGRCGQAAVNSSPTVEALCGQLISRDLSRAVRAVVRLGRADALVARMPAITPDNAESVGCLAAALSSSGVRSPRVTKALLESVQADANVVRNPEPARAICTLGSEAVVLVPELRAQLLEAERLEMQRDVVFLSRAILAITGNDPAALDALRRVTDGHTIEDATWALADVADRVPAAKDTLIDRLASKTAHDWSCLTAAAHGVGEVGAPATAATPHLIRLLSDWTVATRTGDMEVICSNFPQEALRALSRLGASSISAVPALESIRATGDETIRVPAAQALRRIRAKK